MKDLRIGKVGRENFTLPVDVAGEAIALLAKRGAGKTNTATVIAEELFGAGVQVVILDPVGAWWGVRSSADGEGPGLSIPIIGGQHGDVPLEETAGALLADVAVDTRSSLLLDLSDLPSKKAANRFATAFAKRLFYRKARNRDPLHLVLEEADQFCPQSKSKGEEQLVGAFDRMVRLGRSRGIGITMVTQRSAKLNKDILTQADWLVAMRTTGPQDRKAIRDWIDGREREKEVLTSLPDLKPGEAWFWGDEMLERVQVRLRNTFDSSSTPKAGQDRAEPTAPASIDLDQLGAQIQDTAEKAKASDPKTLQRELAAARAEIRRLEQQQAPLPDPEALAAAEQLGRDQALRQVDGVRGAVRRQTAAIVDVARKIEQQTTALYELTGEPWGDGGGATSSGRQGRARKPAPAAARPASQRQTARRASTSAPAELDVSGPQQRILDALAELEHQLAVPQPTRAQLAVFVGVPHTSGGFKNNLGALRTAGLIEYPIPGCVSLTPSGAASAHAEALTSLHEVHDRCRSLVTEPQRSILDHLIGIWPDDISREDLADAVGVPPTSGGFKNNLGRMRTLQLLDYPQPGRVVATDVLFPEGLS